VQVGLRVNIENLVLGISKFNVNKVIRLIENKLEQNQDLDKIRANKFIDNIVNALDVTASRKKFRIPRVWDGKKCSQMR